jgi:hypothetical protein
VKPLRSSLKAGDLRGDGRVPPDRSRPEESYGIAGSGVSTGQQAGSGGCASAFGGVPESGHLADSTQVDRSADPHRPPSTALSMDRRADGPSERHPRDLEGVRDVPPPGRASRGGAGSAPSRSRRVPDSTGSASVALRGMPGDPAARGQSGSDRETAPDADQAAPGGAAPPVYSRHRPADRDGAGWFRRRCEALSDGSSLCELPRPDAPRELLREHPPPRRSAAIPTFGCYSCMALDQFSSLPNGAASRSPTLLGPAA